MLDFPAGLQTSRLRSDERWTLGAANVGSGNPPAIRAGHNWIRNGQSGSGAEGFGSPHFFIIPVNFYLFCEEKNKILENTTQVGYNVFVFARILSVQDVYLREECFNNERI